MTQQAITYLIISVISYFLGLGTGLILNNLANKQNSNPDLYKNIVLIVVTTAWSLSVVVEMLSPSYETNYLIHGLMGTVVGFFYKLHLKPTGGNK